jgi:sterol desaturase/sphingolipid hydroxylase (fatty acid hydroxylase superfamily)
MPLTDTSVAMLALTVIAVYYLTTLMIWFGHYEPHRPASRLRRFHMGGHHRHYPNSRHGRSERFLYGRGRHDSLVPQLPWLIGLAVAVWAVLPARVGWVAVAQVVLVAVAHSYVHMHFHLTKSWLARFSWFRLAQARHDLHHDRRTVNFMVADYFWDKVFGTFATPELDTVSRHRASPPTARLGH